MPHSVNSKSFSTDSWLVRQTVSEHLEPDGLHQHDSYTFYLHICNGVAYQVGGRLIPLQPYQLLVIPPNCPHGLVGSEPRINYERLYVQVHPRLLSQLTFGSASVRDIVDQHCQSENQQVYLSPLEYLHLKALAAAVPDAETAAPMDKLEAQGYLIVMVCRFCRALQQRSSPLQTAADALMQAVHNHIQTYFAQDCSLNRLSELFNVSKYHLSRRFSETYGLSLHQFLLRCRIAHAQVLIRQGETMAAVFERCGFNDYSSFVRAFTSIAGMSPRTWRTLDTQQPALQPPSAAAKQAQNMG